VFFSLLFFSQALLAGNKHTVTLLTDNNYPPYSYVENGELKGISVEIVNLVGQHLSNYNIELKPVRWTQGLKQVRTGKALGIVGVYFSGKHRPYLYPYSDSLIKDEAVIVCADNAKVKSPIRWPQSFAGNIVLNIAGFDGWLNFKTRDAANTALVNFLEVPNHDTVFKMLRRGNADCAFSGAVQAKAQVEKLPSLSIVNNVSTQFIRIGYSTEYWQSATAKETIEFARDFDFALQKMREQGELPKL
jgi:polar amino acid transport system substrate-binding protein